MQARVQRPAFGRKLYSKEATVIIDVSSLEKVSAMEIVEAVHVLCGVGVCLACRPSGNQEFELTMETKEQAALLLVVWILKEIIVPVGGY